MTFKQITKALTKAGISIEHCEISRDCVEVQIPDGEGEGQCDADKCYEVASAIATALGFNGLRSRAHGGWGVYPEARQLGEFGDRSSPIHY